MHTQGSSSSRGLDLRLFDGGEAPKPAAGTGILFQPRLSTLQPICAAGHMFRQHNNCTPETPSVNLSWGMLYICQAEHTFSCPHR